MYRVRLYFISLLIILILCKAYPADTKVQEACVVSPVLEYRVTSVPGMKYHWEVEGGIILSENKHENIIKIQWNGVGDHRLSVYGEFEGCYTDKRDLVVRLKNPPIVNLGPDIELCKGQRYTFEVDTGYASVMWQDSSLGLWYTASNSETVWVKVENTAGCEATDTVKVFVHELPVVDLGPDTMLCGDASITLSAYNEAYPGAIYLWNVTDEFGYSITTPDIKIASDAPGMYWVKVTDVNNCSNYDTINIIQCNVVLEKTAIPTVFTPNGDGKNDVWKLDALRVAYPNSIVEVYDRWGRMVFRSERGYPTPWDGRDRITGRPAPMNNYFYIIYPNKKGESIITGTVTIAR